MYKLAFSDKKVFLEVKAAGELTPATDLAIDEEIKRECTERSMNSVLIDIRYMKSRLTGIENHVAALSFNQRMQCFSSVAILDTDKYRANSEMFELTARNRDANVKFFVNKPDAIEWLLEQNLA